MTVIRHLRNEDPQMLKRVVLVTASPDTILRSIAGDVFAVVHKPFTPDALIATITRLTAK
jgi:CheY-like chemotaxis protein